MTYNVVRSVLNAAGQAIKDALPGARVRVTLPVPALHIAGAQKDDSGAGADPVTGHTFRDQPDADLPLSTAHDLGS